ncbi:unnamed protein product [Ilex paraguariensis]|uniref:F-box domain-containing protein n=1 Tax=Ilex paraguariensis TaxID=185542 RepID=A0ABC8RPM0_9AQUA
MRETEGKQEKSTKMEIDQEGSRINSLPDSLLLHILSFLEMKYVMRTSVVSKRWKDLWASVPNLIFSLSKSDVRSEPLLRKFMDFVDRVLLLRDSTTIQKFSLAHRREWWERPFNLNHINSWVCTVTKCNVEHHIVDVYLADYELFNVPSSLFTCKSLVELCLADQVFIDFPSSIYLPNLKTLKFSMIGLGDGLNQRLFSGLPRLENLSIHVHSFSDEDMDILIDIFAPKLREVRMFLIAGKADYYPNVHNVKVLIDSPMLEYLLIDDICDALYSIKNKSSSLVKAQIEVGPDFSLDAGRVLETFKGVSQVKHMELFGSTMRALGSVDGNALFTFRNLTHLGLSYDNLLKLPEALQRMPILESLDVCNWTGKEDRSEVEDIDLSDDDDLSGEFNWLQSEIVPSCLVTHLRVVRFDTFEGKNDVQLVKYLLKNSKVLGKMTISLPCYLSGEKKKFHEKILKFPTGSKTCQVQFS